MSVSLQVASCLCFPTIAAVLAMVTSTYVHILNYPKCLQVFLTFSGYSQNFHRKGAEYCEGMSFFSDRTANEGPVLESKINVWCQFMYTQKWNCAAHLFPIHNYNVLSPNSYTHISVRDLFTVFPGSVCLCCCIQICGQILGIYKSLTDIWMWKLGLKRNT